MIVKQVWARTPAEIWVRTWGLVLFVVIVCAAAAINFSGHPTLTHPQPFVVALVVIAVVMHMRRRRRCDAYSPLAAYLAAHRLCGACGYDLHQLSPEPDQRVVCPECGAAWHIHRFVMAAVDPRGTPQLAALVASGHSFPSRDRDDDRGMPMVYAWRWPPQWLHSDSSPELLPAPVVVAERASRRRLRAWGLPAAFVAWLLFAGLIIETKDDLERGQVILTCVVTLLITAIIYYALVERFLPERSMRDELKALGVCLSCGDMLPSGAPRAFDGCVVCLSCRRAWRAKI